MTRPRSSSLEAEGGAGDGSGMAGRAAAPNYPEAAGSAGPAETGARARAPSRFETASGPGAAQLWSCPPVTSSSEPVTNELSSAAMNTNAGASSSGCPARPSALAAS